MEAEITPEPEPQNKALEREVLSEDEIGELVKQDIEAAKQYQKFFLRKWRELYRLYRAVIDPKYNIEGRSKITCADVMDTIEWVMPSLMRIFTGGDDVVVLQPVGPEDVEAAELMQQLLNYQFNYKMDGFLKLYTWFKEALIYGTGVIKITWDKRYEKKNFYFDELTEEEFEALKSNPNISIEGYDEYEDIEANITQDTEVVATQKVYRNVVGFVKRVVYEGPVLENIPITAFYIEPGARTISEANFVAHRTIRTMDYLRRMQREGIYHNVEKVIPKDEVEVASEDLLVMAEDKVPELSVKSPSPPGREKVEVWECWVKLDIDGDGLLEPLLVTIANDVVIRVEQNPFEHGEPPFEILVPIIDVHRFYGISLAELVAEFQKIKTALIRMLLDNIAFVTNKMFIVQRSAGVDTKSLANSRPGGVIFADNIAGVKDLQISPLPPYVFNILEYLETMKEARSGISRFQQGLDPRSLTKTTATGVAAVMSAAQQRLELIARVFAETGVKRLFRKLISLNQQYINQETVIRIFNKELRITPDALDGSFDLLVNVGVGAGLKEVQAQKMIQLLNIMPSLAQIGLVKPIHVYHVVVELLKAMGIKDVNKYIQQPEEQTQPQQPLPQQRQIPRGNVPPILEGLVPPQATGEVPSPFSLPKKR